MDLDRFVGRVAVLTGAGGGLGAAMAEDLVEAGLIVVGVDVNIEPVKELAARLAGRRGKLHPQLGDISKEADLERVFGWVEKHLGPVAVMVNNAATNHPAPFEDIEHEKMSRLVNTNVLGTAAACSRALKSMKTHSIKDGHIVNVSSILGHGQGVTRYALDVYPIAVYCATKHAITGLSRALRAELLHTHPQGFNIRVTNLCPGLVKTNMANLVMQGNVPDRHLVPADLARALHFVLACPPTMEISEIIVQPTGEVY